MMLLIDVGNSRVKWAWGQGGMLSEQISLAYRGELGRDWLDALGTGGGKQAQRILISNVAGPRMADALRGLLEKQFRVEPEFASVASVAAGVTCAYRDPQQLGVDRWLAVIGAWHRAGHSACVIDSGTATTVDAVDDSGTHLGGLILPGLDLMVDVLLTRTSDIAQAVDPATRAKSGVFADNTLAAVRNGAVLATAALAERAASDLARRTAGEPKLYLTGGNATRIAPSLARAHEVVPDLVLHGLAVWGR
jgi:type III pantothenate kinase